MAVPFAARCIKEWPAQGHAKLICPYLSGQTASQYSQRRRYIVDHAQAFFILVLQHLLENLLFVKAEKCEFHNSSVLHNDNNSNGPFPLVGKRFFCEQFPWFPSQHLPGKSQLTLSLHTVTLIIHYITLWDKKTFSLYIDEEVAKIETVCIRIWH